MELWHDESQFLRFDAEWVTKGARLLDFCQASYFAEPSLQGRKLFLVELHKINKKKLFIFQYLQETVKCFTLSGSEYNLNDKEKCAS